MRREPRQHGERRRRVLVEEVVGVLVPRVDLEHASRAQVDEDAKPRDVRGAHAVGNDDVGRRPAARPAPSRRTTGSSASTATPGPAGPQQVDGGAVGIGGRPELGVESRTSPAGAPPRRPATRASARATSQAAARASLAAAFTSRSRLARPPSSASAGSARPKASADAGEQEQAHADDSRSPPPRLRGAGHAVRPGRPRARPAPPARPRASARGRPTAPTRRRGGARTPSRSTCGRSETLVAERAGDVLIDEFGAAGRPGAHAAGIRAPAATRRPAGAKMRTSSSVRPG